MSEIKLPLDGLDPKLSALKEGDSGEMILNFKVVSKDDQGLTLSTEHEELYDSEEEAEEGDEKEGDQEVEPEDKADPASSAPPAAPGKHKGMGVIIAIGGAPGSHPAFGGKK